MGLKKTLDGNRENNLLNNFMDFSNKKLTELPSSLPIKVDYFTCDHNKLTDLIGAPQEVMRYFSCASNKLTDLTGAPKYVGSWFDCSNNKLTSLIGAPNRLNEGSFDCSNNKLTDLTGAPRFVEGHFDCSSNRSLTSLFGAPEYIKWHINCFGNKKLIDISDIWNSKIGGKIVFNLNPAMAILPLIKLKEIDCENDDDDLLSSIHKRNQGSTKQNIIDFQYDLIKNGFANNARWKPEK